MTSDEQFFNNNGFYYLVGVEFNVIYKRTSYNELKTCGYQAVALLRLKHST